MNISNLLLIIQTISLVMATILILIQNRRSGLSGALGGRVSDVYLTRRGVEKWVVNLTVFFIVLFVILRIVSLYF